MTWGRILSFVHLVPESEAADLGAKLERSVTESSRLTKSLEQATRLAQDLREELDVKHEILSRQDEQLVALRTSNHMLRQRVTAADREVERLNKLLDESQLEAKNFRIFYDGCQSQIRSVLDETKQPSLNALITHVKDLAAKTSCDEAVCPLAHEMAEILGVESTADILSAVTLLTRGEGEAVSHKLSLVDDPAKDVDEVGEKAELVYDREIPGVFEIAKISFIEGNRWHFQNGSARFSATIEDEAFLERVARREQSFAHGDVFHVRLAARTWRKPGGGLKSEYRVLEITEIEDPSEQLSFTDLPVPEGIHQRKEGGSN